MFEQLAVRHDVSLSLSLNTKREGVDIRLTSH